MNSKTALLQTFNDDLLVRTPLPAKILANYILLKKEWNILSANTKSNCSDRRQVKGISNVLSP